MAGYVRNKRIYKLVFEDPEYEGLVIRARSITLGRLRDIETSEATDDEADSMLKAFADSLVDWNLEDIDREGSQYPVPMTVDGLLSQEPDFVRLLIDTWIESITGLNGPLGQQSSSGPQSQEQSNLTELASLSQVS